MPSNPRQRRTADQWRAIIQRFEAANLTPIEFYRREGLSLTSFGRWRHRFDADDEKSCAYSKPHLAVSGQSAPSRPDAYRVTRSRSDRRGSPANVSFHTLGVSSPTALAG